MEQAMDQPTPSTRSEQTHRTVDQVESAALSLPRCDRVRLLDALNASLAMDPEIERAWDEEIRRRLADLDAGRAKTIPGEDVMKEVRDLLR
jgi:putative addiction module component (TIGR02574 family)